MTVRIRQAQTTDELDQVFALRHRVMVDEEGYMTPEPDGRITDRFDAYPATANVVAVVEDRVVGAMRFTERTAAGTPADRYFDFRPFLPAGACVVSASLLVLERAHRGTPRLVFAMFGFGYSWAIARGATHVLAPSNPERRAALTQRGYRIVAPQFHHERSGLPVLPMLLDLANLDDPTIAFVSRQDIRHWLRSAERQFHAAGELVLRRGAPGDAAYVVIDGQASIELGHGVPSVELGPGDVFGELALLTDRPRTADVVAVTDLDLMVLDRAAFRTQLRADPEASERMLELLADKMASAVDASATSA